MKIKLERKLTSCPERLRCIVCSQVFELGKIRTLLYNDRGLIQGDICLECMKLKADQIKQKLREQALVLMEQTELCSSPTRFPHELALELLDSSTEDIKFPTFYQRLIVKISSLSPETQELEATRLGLSSGKWGRRSRGGQGLKGRSRLRIFFWAGNR